MEAKVRSFNNLPRSEITPSADCANNWVFGVWYADIYQPGDFVLAVNLECRHVLEAGPAQILSLPTTREKAEATIPYLLDAFLRPGHDSVPTFAPWSWSTLDPAMARAMEDGLKGHGVRPELCSVGVCTAEEGEILEERREAICKDLASRLRPPLTQRESPAPGDSTKCHGCGMDQKSFLLPLKACAGCGQAFYHSRNCQIHHRRIHNSVCQGPGAYPSPSVTPALKPVSSSPPSSPASIHPLIYYNIQAKKDPAAQALINLLCLQGHPDSRKLAFPMHRLVITGKDTPENLRLLFGPGSTSTEIRKLHSWTRVERLLDAPVGSPHYNRSMQWSHPSVIPVKPAAPTWDERRFIVNVRRMQKFIQQSVGYEKCPSEAEKQGILLSFRPDRVTDDKLEIYTMAVNTIDQKLPVPECCRR